MGEVWGAEVEMSSACDVSVIVACYNEEGHLEASVRELVAVLDTTRWSYEIVFVEDCSTDNTREVLKRVAAAYPDKAVQVILHEKNTGRGRTVSDGIRAARGTVVGFIDIDLEVHARYIPSCVLSILRGADVATGWREYRLHLPLLHRHILSRGYVFIMQWLLRVPLRDTESGYKFFRRASVLKVLDEVEDPGWFWDTEIMVRCYHAGQKIEEIPCLFIRRYDKKSTVRVVHDSIEYFKKLWHFRRTVKTLGQP